MPYRDSAVTKLLAAGIGGVACAFHLLHVRLDNYNEAEATLVSIYPFHCMFSAPIASSPRPRPILCKRAWPPWRFVQALGVKLARLRASRAKSPWWNPRHELEHARCSVDELCRTLRMEGTGLKSSSISLDESSSDELLQLQSLLLRTERLEVSCVALIAGNITLWLTLRGLIQYGRCLGAC